MRKINFTEYEVYVEDLIVDLLAKHIRPTHVVGISRGGLIPGVMLSHYFDVPLIPLVWSTRDFAQQEQTTIEKASKLENATLLVVDDINDTGLTFEQITQAFRDLNTSIYTASVLVKPHSVFQVDCYGLALPDNDWIVFPYEQTEDQ